MASYESHLTKKEKKNLVTVYKGRPPEGGRGGFKIVDENGHGGEGVQEEWMSTFQDLPKYNCYQNLTHLKNQSGAATIYGRT